MQESTDTSPREIPEDVYRNGAEVITKTLPLLDNAYRRWAFDLYATQLSNAKNYLWVSFVIMSACVAFFNRSGLSATLLGAHDSFLSYVVLLMLVFTFTSSLTAFFRGVRMATGSGSYEPVLAIPDTINDMECELYSPMQVYQSQRGLVEIYDSHIQKACQEVNRRGHQLSLMGEDVRLSISCGLGTLLMYWISCL